MQQIPEISLRSVFFCRGKGKSIKVLLYDFIVSKIGLKQSFGYLDYLTK